MYYKPTGLISAFFFNFFSNFTPLGCAGFDCNFGGEVSLRVYRTIDVGRGGGVKKKKENLCVCGLYKRLFPLLSKNKISVWGRGGAFFLSLLSFLRDGMQYSSSYWPGLCLCCCC